MGKKKTTVAPKVDCPEAWRVECERAVFHANVLLRLARITGGTMAAVVELIRTVPRSRKDVDNMSTGGLFFRIALEADRLRGNDELFRSAMGYFGELMEMAPERRSRIEASVTGVLMGFMMG
jgi:hypothetical protein